MKKLLVALLTLASLQAAAQADRPSREPVKGCQWEKLSDASVGLAVWTQQCDFGFRKIRTFFQGSALVMQYSDGGGPENVIEVIDQRAAEAPRDTLKRVFVERTAADVRDRCVLTEHRGHKAAPAGKQRFTFVPDAAYQKELAAKADPNEVPEPACGEFGEMPDGVQYFEVATESRVRKVLFVRVGQDEPLFDEQTLQLIELTTTTEVPCCDYQPGPNGITADFLLETCSVTGQTAYGMIPYFDCQSYVLAVLDTYRSMRGGKVCPPTELTTRKVLELVGTRFKFERDGQRRAADVILEALQGEFACMTASR